MQRLIALTFTLAILMPTAFAAEEGIPGVKGTVYQVDGNKEKDAKKPCQIKAKVGDMVVVEWTYPIAPPFPASAEQKSSDESVMKGQGVARVVKVPTLIGTGTLGASFKAEKPGKANVTFSVKAKDTVNVVCEVEVAK